jgi:molecular chaperone GrpE
MAEKNKKETEDEKEGKIEIEYITPKKKTTGETKEEKDQSKTLKNTLKKKESEIKLLKKELDSLKDEFLRKAADMENLRKRLEREKNEYFKYALNELLRDLLSILDNFERALESQNQRDEGSLQKGVEMIYKQLFDLLVKQGVSTIEIKEKKFDPHLHQAFITEESGQVKEPQVEEELQKGYTIHDRLLRPSLVKVLVPKKDN